MYPVNIGLRLYAADRRPSNVNLPSSPVSSAVSLPSMVSIRLVDDPTALITILTPARGCPSTSSFPEIEDPDRARSSEELEALEALPWRGDVAGRPVWLGPAAGC